MAIVTPRIDITIIDKPGKDNGVAYFISRLTNVNDDPHAENSFIYEYLFLYRLIHLHI